MFAKTPSKETSPKVRRRLFFDSSSSKSKSKSKKKIIKISLESKNSEEKKSKKKISNFPDVSRRRRKGVTINMNPSTKAKLFFEEAEKKGLKAVKTFLKQHRGSFNRKQTLKNQRFSSKKKKSKSKKKSISKGKIETRLLHPKEDYRETESSSSSSSEEDSEDFDPIEIVEYRDCVINPEGELKLLWDTIVAVFILYSSIITPFKLSFVPDNYYIFWDVFDDFFVGSVFFLDMILNFMTPVYVNHELVIDQKKIICDYLRFWFWLDLLSIFPFELIFEIFFQDDFNDQYSVIHKAVALPKIWKLFRLARLLRTLKIKKKQDTFIGKIYKILIHNRKLLISIVPIYALNVIIAHILASAWHSLALVDESESWIARFGWRDEPFFDRYMASFYYIYSTVTTTGYGDITPFTFYENLLTIFTQLIGVVFYSFTYNKIFQSLKEHREHEMAVEKKKIMLKKLVKDGLLKGKLGRSLKYRILRLLEEEKKGLKKNKKKPDFNLARINQKHAKQLKLEVAHSKYQFNYMNFFKHKSEEFKIFFFDNMEKHVYRKGDIIYERGMPADAFYVILSGKVWYLLKEEKIESKYLPSDSESEEESPSSKENFSSPELSGKNSKEKTDVKKSKKKRISRIFDQNSDTKSLKSDKEEFYYHGYKTPKKRRKGSKKADRKKVKNLPFFEIDSYFGEIELLQTPSKRNYTVIAPCKTVVYWITKQAFQDLFGIEKDHIDLFLTNVHQRIQNIKKAYSDTTKAIEDLRRRNLKKRASFIKKRLNNKLIECGVEESQDFKNKGLKGILENVQPSDQSKNSYFRTGGDVKKDPNVMKLSKFSQYFKNVNLKE